MHENILPVAGTELQLTKKSYHLFWNTCNPNFTNGIFACASDVFVDLLFSFCNYLLDTPWMNSPIFTSINANRSAFAG